MLNEKTFFDLIRLRMTCATIHEPTGKSDSPHKFTAGLILGLPFDAVIENVTDIRNIRIKVNFNLYLPVILYTLIDVQNDP